MEKGSPCSNAYGNAIWNRIFSRLHFRDPTARARILKRLFFPDHQRDGGEQPARERHKKDKRDQSPQSRPQSQRRCQFRIAPAHHTRKEHRISDGEYQEQCCKMMPQRRKNRRRRQVCGNEAKQNGDGMRIRYAQRHDIRPATQQRDSQNDSRHGLRDNDRRYNRHMLPLKKETRPFGERVSVCNQQYFIMKTSAWR